MRLIRCVAAAGVAIVLSACATATPEGYAAPQPRDGKAGLRLTGSVGGKQIALSDGTPELVLGDCDPSRGASQDLCFVSRVIDGTVLAVIIRNPGVLEEGATLPVRAGDCSTPRDCSEVTGVAVVDLRVGDQRLRRAESGVLAVTTARTGLHYAGTIRLGLRDGTVSGAFDVVPRPS